jgi:ParB-like chromosome segregation protein Spo0J
MAPKTPEIAATWEPTSTLRPWDKNPRKNDGEPVARVAKSIQRFGFSSPIVARLADRRIIAGHTRWKAAKKLGMETVPVRFLDIDEDQAAALALADNKLSEITPWDDDALADVLREIEAAGVDMDGLGWSTEEIDALLGAPSEDCDAPADPFAVLPDGAPEFRQMTFTLTYDQHEQVEAAIRAAIGSGPFVDTGNTNRNGNALARIAEAFHG